MSASARVTMIRERLQTALSPVHLEITDESHKHAGHAGAQTGGGHFHVTLVTDIFSGQGLLQRHRMVYDALGAALNNDIHALSIKAYTPQEFATLPTRNIPHV
jgi:BolA protein